MRREQQNPLIAGAVVTGLGTLASRVLGLVRDMATAALLGMGGSAVMDAFVIANRIPNLFRQLFGEGALTASYLPVVSGLLEKDRRSAWQLASTMMVWLARAPGRPGPGGRGDPGRNMAPVGRRRRHGAAGRARRHAAALHAADLPGRPGDGHAPGPGPVHRPRPDAHAAERLLADGRVGDRALLGPRSPGPGVCRWPSASSWPACSSWACNCRSCIGWASASNTTGRPAATA